MKIAVTAASGKLGANIIQELLKYIDSEKVVGIARTLRRTEHLGVEIRKGDYNIQQDFEKALKDVDTVLLVSGMDHPKNRILQHRHVIEAAKNNGVEKIVYTSIIGDETPTAFSPIIQSNRQTERDLKDAGLKYVIGRNGLYIEPDLEYIDQYEEIGAIRNCAGNGLCSYTSRKELAAAYAKMLLEEHHNGQTYDLVGESISQQELAHSINEVYHTKLTYKPMSVEAFIADRKKELGEFLGTVVAGIYEGINKGAFQVASDFEKAAGRPHLSMVEMIKDFKENSKKVV